MLRDTYGIYIYYARLKIGSAAHRGVDVMAGGFVDFAGNILCSAWKPSLGWDRRRRRRHTLRRDQKDFECEIFTATHIHISLGDELQPMPL